MKLKKEGESLRYLTERKDLEKTTIDKSDNTHRRNELNIFAKEGKLKIYQDRVK